MKTLAMLCSIALVSLSAASCGPVLRTTEPSRIPPGTAVPSPMGPGASIEFEPIQDSVWQEGAKIELRLSFTNRVSIPLTMTPFPPDIKVVHDNEDRPDIFVRHMLGGAGERELAAGESADYVFSWDQRDDSGNQVSPGWYVLEIAVARRDSSSGTVGFIGGGTRLLITPPEGAMEKTIVVNDSQSIGEVTLKLEQVELSSTGTKVSMFTSPAGYDLPQGPSLPPPQFMLNVKGEYSIDGGAPVYTGPAGIKFLDNGVEIIWDNLDPVLKNAKELNLRVTSIERGVPSPSYLAGPWDFRIALQ